MTKRLLIVLKYIAENYGEIQVYAEPNTVGDTLEVVYIYDEDLTVNFCRKYFYIEIEGLNAEEVDVLETYCVGGHNILRVDYVKQLDIKNYE